MTSTTTGRRHSFSVHDYPEHLNPFREDEKAASKKHFGAIFRQRLRPGLDNARHMISKLGSPALTRRSIRAVFRKGETNSSTSTSTKDTKDANDTTSSVERRPRASTFDSPGEDSKTTSYSRHTVNGWNGTSTPSSPVAPPRSRFNSIGTALNGSRYEDFTLPRSRRDRQSAGSSMNSPGASSPTKGAYEQWSLPRPRTQREAEAAAAALNACNPFVENEPASEAALPVPLPRTRISVAEEASSTSCMSTPLAPRRGFVRGSGGCSSDVESSPNGLNAYSSMRRSYRKKKRAPLPPGLPTPPRNPETSTPIDLESKLNDSISSFETSKEDKLNISGISALSEDDSDIVTVEAKTSTTPPLVNEKDEIVNINVEITSKKDIVTVDAKPSTSPSLVNEKNEIVNVNVEITSEKNITVDAKSSTSPSLVNEKNEIVEITYKEEKLQFENNTIVEKTNPKELESNQKEIKNNLMKEENMMDSKEVEKVTSNTKIEKNEITSTNVEKDFSRKISLKDILNDNSSTTKTNEEIIEEASKTTFTCEENVKQETLKEQENMEPSKEKSSSSKQDVEEEEMKTKETNEQTIEKTLSSEAERLKDEIKKVEEIIECEKIEKLNENTEEQDLKQKKKEDKKEENKGPTESKPTLTPPPTPLKKKMSTIENLSLVDEDIDADLLIKSPTFKDLPTYTCSFGKTTTRTRLPKLEIVE